jgi:Mn-dependent DtxR family transcriptional regulator
MEYTVGETRREILEAIRIAGGPMSPKQLAEDLDSDHELVKKTVQRMAKDGQLRIVERD